MLHVNCICTRVFHSPWLSCSPMPCSGSGPWHPDKLHLLYKEGCRACINDIGSQALSHTIVRQSIDYFPAIPATKFVCIGIQSYLERTAMGKPWAVPDRAQCCNMCQCMSTSVTNNMSSAKTQHALLMIQKLISRLNANIKVLSIAYSTFACLPKQPWKSVDATHATTA